MKALETMIQNMFHKDCAACTDQEVYEALLTYTKEQLAAKGYHDGKKKIYYISAEFLIGKLLSNNLINLGIYDEVAEFLKKNGKSLAEIESVEPEPSLGNGGLGRLAACFLDSIATLGLPGEGIGLNYHLGLFKQVFEDNLQHEVPNPWITPDSWLTATDVTYMVPFRGFSLKSTMYSIDVAGYENKAEIQIKWVLSEQLTNETADEYLSDCDGILVPGGFGQRGIEGKIVAAQYAREHDVPYLGICLGMQIAVIEFARNVLGLSEADSSEFKPNGPDPVIDLMPDQQGNLPKGGTMRLGAYPCKVQPGTFLEQAYGCAEVQERHRHRYEFNNRYRDIFSQHGMIFSGTSPDDRLVEAVELARGTFYVGVQFHPEFKSRPNRAHPLFREFIKAAASRQK